MPEKKTSYLWSKCIADSGFGIIFSNDIPNEHYRIFRILPVIDFRVWNMFKDKWSIELVIFWLWFYVNFYYVNKKLRTRCSKQES